jgi:hypothetical protein
MTKQVRKPKSDKVKDDYYRSPIDKLVEESGLPATAIAEKMGIKYHRIVALRRMKGVDIADIELCQKAIAELKQSVPKAQTVVQVEKVKATRKTRKTKAKTVSQPNDTQLAYLLGQAMVFIGILKIDAEAQEIDRLVTTINSFESQVKHYLK